ncbi:hypothetical protein ASC80_14985 [Afipia sp. Root123D2]|nr:hypothetical protein ASC80_14985 [Afipia sp. Root123D2]
MMMGIGTPRSHNKIPRPIAVLLFVAAAYLSAHFNDGEAAKFLGNQPAQVAGFSLGMGILALGKVLGSTLKHPAAPGSRDDAQFELLISVTSRPSFQSMRFLRISRT